MEKTKTTTKRVVKKVAAKKRTVASLLLVGPESAFWTVDGVVFHSLEELVHGLKTMHRRVYQFHADADFQDFAVWTKSVLKDKEAAQLLKAAKTQKEAYQSLSKHLKAVYQ